MQDRNSRRAFTTCINRRRLTAKFSLSLDGFTNVGKMMRSALDVACEEGDMKAVRDCIIMSQTFYLKDSSPKLFLHSVITENPLMKTQRFWRDMIENALLSEKNQLGPSPTQEEAKAKVQAMVFGQLSSFSLIMQSFGCAGEVTAQVISDFAQRYDLPPESAAAMLSASDVQGPAVVEKEEDRSPDPRPPVELTSDPLGVSQSVQTLPVKAFSQPL